MPLFNRRSRGGNASGTHIDLGHNEANIDPKTGYKIQAKRPSDRALSGGFIYTKAAGQKGTYSKPPARKPKP